MKYKGGMTNVHCIFRPDFKSLSVYRGDDLVGTVTDYDGDVKLTVYGNRDGIQEFTYSDLVIIWDNWFEMMAQLRQKKPLDSI